MAARPSPSLGRSTAGWLQTMLHRRRGLRWAAAIGAAVAALAALSDGGTEEEPPEPTLAAAADAPLATRLPPGTRGIPVPTDSEVFAAGDAVDVHEIRTGAAVTRGVIVVETTDSETVVAVPAEQVDTVIDALTTGGVILVLAPQNPPPPPAPAPG